MAGPSNPSSYGFFGQGYWGRRVFWEKVPVQHRELDTDGYLESLLKTWGDEAESFLQQISNLPRQREPYEVRAREGEEEWFYFTEAFTYEDDDWGKVVRLVGEKLYADMPDHDEDNAPTSDADELAQWWPWWPYVPISKVARWWEATWRQVPYQVVRVRARSFDWPVTPYNSAASQANEVWLSGGDLQIFFDYFTDGAVWRDDWTEVGGGDGSATPSVALPQLPVRLAFNDTSGAPPWLVANAKLKVRLDLVSAGEFYDVYDVPDGTQTETGNLYPQTVAATNSGATISFALSGNIITITDTSAPFTSGMVGETIRVIGTGSNNGVFEIASFIDTQNVTYVNSGGAAEGGAVGNEWEVGSGQINTATSFGTINYQTGDIVVSLTAAGDTATPGESIVAKWYVRGYYLPFYPPRLIDYLARDFGFENDKNDPEDVQRSTIANITKYHGLKSTQDSYRIRGEISLFDVYARALWYMCDDDLWASLGAGHKFSYHGKLYTDVAPQYIRLDDISADQEFYDPDTTTWQTLVDNAVMYLDNSADGYSIALAYALDVTQGYYGLISPALALARDSAGVVSSVPLTNAEALSYGFQAGYRVVVRMMRCQEYAFNWSKGLFGITEYDKSDSVPPGVDDSVFWIDDVEVPWVQVAAGATADEDVGEWTVIIGVGVDGSGVPYSGPIVGHSDIVAVNSPGRIFTISGDHTGTINPSEKISVMRSTGNDNLYTVSTVTLVGSDTEVLVVEAVPSAVADGEMGWVDAAVKYFPAVDIGNCCYCKSYRMRVEIEPTADAYEFYDTNAGLDAAIDRMKNKVASRDDSISTKIKTPLVPIHARVVDWAITKSWVLENVSGGNTIYEDLVGEFLSDMLTDVSAVDQVNDIFTINGDQRGILAGGDFVTIRGSTGNDDTYETVSITLNVNGEDTDVEVTAAIPSAVADGELYPMPTGILMTVEQRGDMSAAQTQQMTVYDENGLTAWTVTQGTGVSDSDTWYNVVTDWDVLAVLNPIGNNSPVKIEAIDTGGITYGDVRFTFTVSKYSR